MRSAEEKTVLLCALDDDVEGLKRLLESNSATDSKQPENILWEKDEVGRNALFAACTLGRSGIVRELVQNGADVNEFTARGYSPLHCSGMWGQLDTLKTLVELNADFQATNFRGEKAVDVARRYDKLDCAEFLAWAEAKQSLQALIQEVRDIIADQEKIQGKLSKEDKNMCINICSSKSNWIHNTKNATIQDFIEQEKHLEDVLAPILLKINTQSEATMKTRKQ
ncbi:ankyrin repeat domain-containing protein 45 [Rhinichthys klamathensis goyatoka]|uniref:ankyrin repeat domain-containing protein 45 n=1 Tax=Rhinichthys klamathensis goyatoka TaxID=3034132 RepID=UPI0024B5F6BD|nr:ankyrin repeat domain-containing protein 45 [Rhinichthys klamathensis goyatoka]